PPRQPRVLEDARRADERFCTCGVIGEIDSMVLDTRTQSMLHQLQNSGVPMGAPARRDTLRSEEHTSGLQSHRDLHSFPTRRSSDLGEIDSMVLDTRTQSMLHQLQNSGVPMGAPARRDTL